MKDVFISYAGSDRDRVKPIVDALEKQGLSVWWDRTIPVGKTYDRVIEDALSESKCVVVLWSETSVDSDWVRTEASEGFNRRILVPAKLDEVRIPLEFRRVQAADLIEWRGTTPCPGFDALVSGIRSVLRQNPSIRRLVP